MHGTPTVAYREAGGTQESVVDGVSGVLVDDRAELRRRRSGRCSTTTSERARLGRGRPGDQSRVHVGACAGVVRHRRPRRPRGAAAGRAGPGADRPATDRRRRSAAVAAGDSVVRPVVERRARSRWPASRRARRSARRAGRTSTLLRSPHPRPWLRTCVKIFTWWPLPESAAQPTRRGIDDCYSPVTPACHAATGARPAPPGQAPAAPGSGARKASHAAAIASRQLVWTSRTSTSSRAVTRRSGSSSSGSPGDLGRRAARVRSGR